ncbi:putative U3 small nucleolar RNA-associated protein 7 [Lodderomyces elongisporus]|uniref:putative U3 small nucleolar RNA-associated protein 7 n=1 Tax=Lodderomyces elongisporus TaxID=36914 RepID=UPI0029257B29|nr:putative U3 small nucleolar RNA-associated protein 7 [Lodderomyces elongisporus]WLF76815.1 putative U3 small nucleolar RNA-associated protein 7 [Lodderomyces elongisporus]
MAEPRNEKPGNAVARSSSRRKHKFSKDKKLNSKLERINREQKEAKLAAAGTSYLLPEEAGFLEADGPMEKTFKFKQDEIVKAVDASTARKKFELKLPEFGPYQFDYSRNGRDLLLGGKKGHVASMDWRTGHLNCELHLNETVHAVKYLQNEQYFAVAQKKYTFIYDKEGTELHRLKQHIESTLLDFLPYHFLLVGAGHTGFLKYHDVSTGELVSELRTKMGPTLAMKQNPWNAIMHLGHGNGQVSLWSPNAPEPLVKMQSSRGPIRDLAIDREGKYMVVSGADKTMKVWDLRKFKELDHYYTQTPASSLDISDTGLLSVGWSSHVTIWKDLFKGAHQSDPYMNHLIPGSKVDKVKFAPFEDILGVGHQTGFNSLIVPGAGEANFDALEINPYESAKQRQEQEVRSLLNKLPADSISIDPNMIGTVDKRAKSIRLKPGEISDLSASGDANSANKMEVKPDVKGKNSALRRHLRRKRENVIDQRKLRIEKNLRNEKEARARRLRMERDADDNEDVLKPVLARFN